MSIHFFENQDVYFEKCAEAQEIKGSTPLSKEERQSIALEAGISEEIWETIQYDFKKHLKTAKKFIHQNNDYDKFEEGIEILKAMEAIYSPKAFLYYEIGRAYYKKLTLTFEDEDAVTARYYILESLELEPEYEAANKLLQKLDENKVRKLIKDNRVDTALGCGCFTFLGFLVIWFVYDVYFKSNEDSYAEINDRKNQEVFIEFVKNDLSKDIVFDLEHSRIKEFESGQFYLLEAEIENNFKTLQQIFCAISFFDESRNFIDSTTKVFHHLNYEPIKKGDRIPIWQFRRTDEEFAFRNYKYAQIEITELSEYQNEIIFDKEEIPIELVWSVKPPKNVNISATKRKFLDAEVPDSSLVFHYKGSWPIPYFTYQLQWTLNDGSEIRSDTINAAQLETNNFRPNTSRVGRLVGRPEIENTDAIKITKVVITDCRFE